MKDRLIVDQVSLQLNEKILLDKIKFIVPVLGHLAILGDSGSGKTLLAKALAQKQMVLGRIQYNSPNPTIKFISQQHHFTNRSNTEDFYYQQRYNAVDADDTYTVVEMLVQEGFDRSILNLFELHYLSQTALLSLSNGENKKLQLSKALSTKADVLILDQPFIGLDIKSRKALHTFLNNLATKGTFIILITGREEVPKCITHLLFLEKGRQSTFLSQTADNINLINTPEQFQLCRNESNKNIKPSFEIAVALKNVTIRYGAKIVLNNINWTVRRSEKWLLKGANGAGKSTLLSLLTADNPQSYAHDIILFDKQRGSGESIWDIKSKIGYLSPELHLYFEKDISVFKVIASGFFDSIGLFTKLNSAQNAQVNEWLALLQFEDIAERKMYEISLGQQRLVLLARALIKTPPLLVLDEPCQGMDDSTKDRMNNLIDFICQTNSTTLIYVTHFDNEIPAQIDHILELEDGSISKIEKINYSFKSK